MANIGETMFFYCMKCKKKVETKVEEANKTKRGTTMNVGHCSCGTKVCAISK